MEPYFENLGNHLSLKDRVYQSIKYQILLGNLKPGVRLLEEELAKAMNISRAPIREAFNRLEKEGFVTIIPRRGAAVSIITIQTILDIFEIRENLETLAVKKSLGKISMEHLEEIGNKFREFVHLPTSVENRMRYLILDKKFHNLLIDNCGNQKLIEILYNLQEQIHWIRNISLKKITFFGSVKEHLAIIAALQENEANMVIKCLLDHLKRARESSIQEINFWNKASNSP